MSGNRSRRVAFAAAACLAATACEDAPYEPAALLLTPDVEAAIDIASELPTLARLVDSALPRCAPGSTEAVALERARARWIGAEREADDARAARLRERAYAEAAVPLALVLRTEELSSARRSLDEWLGTARALPGANAIPELARALTQGGRLLDDAATFETEGRREAAIRATLAAADVLARTTPRGVAVRLVAIAERRMELQAADGVSTGTDARRADRLLRGAREALADGDYPLAIRRAYYAGQLLKDR